jgi:hypothetical protein
MAVKSVRNLDPQPGNRTQAAKGASPVCPPRRPAGTLRRRHYAWRPARFWPRAFATLMTEKRSDFHAR